MTTDPNSLRLMIRDYIKDRLTIHVECKTIYPSYGSSPPYRKLEVSLRIDDEEISSDWVEVSLDD
jgi:hypothetical protein